MLLLIISFLVIAVYMAAVCIKAKGVPYSISATYYTLDHKLIFGASMALTAMFLSRSFGLLCGCWRSQPVSV